MSLRTLKFGDRTISYDAGLNSLSSSDNSEVENTEEVPPSPDVDHQTDDGIGSSDDDKSESNDLEESSAFESDSSPNIRRKKVIKPDQSAINQLLAFDEEEEDDYEEDDALEPNNDGIKSSQKGWHKTIVKDLANLSPSSGKGHGLQRRHSISICESKAVVQRKTSTAESASSGDASPPLASSCVSPYSLNVSQMHESLQDEFETTQPWMGRTEALQTLNLRLDEVAHIRSVLTKAELESLPLDGNVRDNVEKGKVCFLCMKTKFGLFSRGQNCEMCKQIVCHRCHTKMRIPLEHFSAMPVYALSPVATAEEAAPHAMDNNSLHSTVNGKEKKLSLPNSLGLLENKSVGSAPNSPGVTKRALEADFNQSQLATISANVVAPESIDCGPVSLPQHKMGGKYATLPTKTRRMSWMSSRDVEREKLEGSLLAVCTDCKDMVLQVIRTSRTTKRMQMVRSMFLRSNVEEKIREHRL